MASGGILEGNDLLCSFCQEYIDDTGIPLEGCEHSFCRTCFEELVSLSRGTQLMCPFTETCAGYLPNDVVKYLVPDDMFEQYIGQQDDATTKTSACQFIDNTQSDGLTYRTRKSMEVDKTDGWFHLQAYIKSMEMLSLDYDKAEKTVDTVSVIPTAYEIQCSICIEDVAAGSAIVIKECLHMFCRTCLESLVKFSNETEVNCPQPNCDATLKPQEMRQLCSLETYDKHYTELSLNAVVDNPNMFHCLTPNCKYFVEFDTNSPNGFKCPLCKNHSCRNCKVSHGGMSCNQYHAKIEEDKRRLEELKRKETKLRQQKEEDEKNRIEQQQNEQLGAQEIQRRLQSGVFKKCPKCFVVVEKNMGCDHMTCWKCKYQFYWSTLRRFP